MNSNFSCLWYSVLIFGLSLSAAEELETDGANDEALHECLGQYLKNKGKLNDEVQTNKEMPMCQLNITALSQSYRDEFEVKVNAQHPNGADCAMTQFDETELTEFILTVAFYHTDSLLPESEKKTLLRALKKEGDDKMNAMTSKCGVNGKLFDNFMDAVFSTSSGESTV